MRKTRNTELKKMFSNKGNKDMIFCLLKTKKWEQWKKRNSAVIMHSFLNWKWKKKRFFCFFCALVFLVFSHFKLWNTFFLIFIFVLLFFLIVNNEFSLNIGLFCYVPGVCIILGPIRNNFISVENWSHNCKKSGTLKVK